jgi:hypothetical protein
MRNKVCVLRDSAEIEALRKLQALQRAIRAGQMTEAEADIQFQPFVADLPHCDHHIHKTQREARKQETQGTLAFLPGWDEQYAKTTQQWHEYESGRRVCGELLSTGLRIGQLELYAAR